MPKILKESLMTIEAYKTTSPHYVELLDILSDILILREEYRKDMADVFTSVDESLIATKMAGGLPLIDFSCGRFDLSKPREYFLALLGIAEKPRNWLKKSGMVPMILKKWSSTPFTRRMTSRPQRWKKIFLTSSNCFLRRVSVRPSKSWRKNMSM
jgi:hypothetical protein